MTCKGRLQEGSILYWKLLSLMFVAFLNIYSLSQFVT